MERKYEMEWNEMEWDEMGWNEMEWNATQLARINHPRAPT
jgi:hypothetical protein